MSTAADLRRIARTLEGTSEAPHFDRTAFKVARIYVTLAADGRSANFKFAPRRAGAEMHGCAGRLRAGAQRLGQARLDNRDIGKTDGIGIAQRAGNSLAPCASQAARGQPLSRQFPDRRKGRAPERHCG